MGTDVKICGITCREDAEVAAKAGARYFGAVMYAASPRNVSAETARDFSADLDPDLVIVVADAAPDAVVSWARRSNAAVVQLHGDESPEVARQVRNAGDWQVWKAVRARDAATVYRAVERYGAVVDGFLVDGWHPDLIGGTGVRVGWDELTDLRERVGGGRQLVAAGGLTPENVGQVVSLARPHVVDVRSGVERVPGRKEPDRSRAVLRVGLAAVRVQREHAVIGPDDELGHG